MQTKQFAECVSVLLINHLPVQFCGTVEICFCEGLFLIVMIPHQPQASGIVPGLPLVSPRILLVIFLFQDYTPSNSMTLPPGWLCTLGSLPQNCFPVSSSPSCVCRTCTDCTIIVGSSYSNMMLALAFYPNPSLIWKKSSVCASSQISVSPIGNEGYLTSLKPLLSPSFPVSGESHSLLELRRQAWCNLVWVSPFLPTSAAGWFMPNTIW